MQKPLRKIFLAFGSIIALFIFIYMFKVNSSNSDTDYYVNTDLKFNGKIIKVKPLSDYGHDYGVILIDVYESNMEHYDPRDSLKRFLGVLKNGKMELVFNRISEIKDNDSIDFNVEEYKIYRNNKLIRDDWINMPPDDIFRPFNEIERIIEL